MNSSQGVSIPLPRAATNAFSAYAGFVFLLALLFGGGARQGLWSDVAVELAALPLLVWAVLKVPLAELNWLGRFAIVVLCAILALPLLQLVPLPPIIWSSLPGRADIASAYESAGMALHWLPVSLDPASTWRGLLSLLPATAIFLAMLSLPWQMRRILVAMFLVIACFSVPLDLLQLIGGRESALRFYAITNTERAVGFFANSNHNAAFLYCAIPIAIVCAVAYRSDDNSMRKTGPALLLLALALYIVGLALTQSRAGLALGLIAGLSCLVLVRGAGSGKSRRWMLLYGGGGTLVALLIAFQVAFVGIAERAESTDLAGDFRWRIVDITSTAVGAHLPFGSGFGTFVAIYEMFNPRSLMKIQYVNHAHNDWLELALEGGVLALVLGLAFLIWWAFATKQLWKKSSLGRSEINGLLGRAAAVAIGLLLLHSTVDYPLRTIAMMAIFALCSAFLVLPNLPQHVPEPT